jgi:hypothetical protein
MNQNVPIRSKKVKTYLFISSMIWTSALVISLMPALMSVMIFDSPGSEERLVLWVLFWAMFSFPLVTAIAIAGGWVFYFLKHNRLAIGTTLLPLINIATIVGSFIAMG